ncbi:MAG: polysaccharide deacetylase family protein [Alishewanella agri]|uniref:Polysaccharide deacetylase n=1 Tax=Alishewanella agri BL06 TaxID=1195246 RepID=I9P0R0_9ALTE|nr:polysaccharide deacetylase family protein [Alishewanella agri]EIW88314.1 polysaccharide deacetylase [Alishewanella agri BL06]MDD4863680.1 polysaccharide deacetylase family protein [Alishewanella agri]
MRVLLLCCLLLLSLPASAAVMLIYHHVAEDTPRVSSVTAAEFRGHLQYLRDNHFQVIGLDVLIDQLKSGKPIADNAVVITFDDSYENNFTTAHPILQEFGYPYTIFISPGDIDKGTGPVMNWQQIKQMSEDGVLVANHAMWHEHMARPEPGESEADWLKRMRQSILDAERRIKEETGQNHQWLAYPYGEFSAKLEQLVQELGFIGIGQQSGAIGPLTKLTRIPRYPAAGQYADLKDLAQKLRTLAFPITDYLAADQVISANPPTLRLQLDITDFRKQQLRCFAGAEVLEPVWLNDNTFEVKASKALNRGRSRYNCTAPSLSKKGYFYWYSQPWLN